MATLFTIDSPSNDNTRISEDTVIPFLLNQSHIRGRIVKMGSVIDTILSRHDYPLAVKHLLGEALLVAGLLGTMMKENGLVTIQAKGNGPVNFLVVDCTSDGKLRGYVNLAEGHDFRKIRPGQKLEALLGEGHLAITMDHPAQAQRYQGIVSLSKESLADCIVDYFTTSEQLDANLKLVVGRVKEKAKGKKAGNPRWYAGGVLIQRVPQIPDESGETYSLLDDKWDEASVFIDSVRDKEILDPTLESDQLLYRLFHKDGVWVYDPASLSAECRCSRDKIESFLRTMPADDIEDMKKNGVITVNCEFCGQEEVFSDDELKKLR